MSAKKIVPDGYVLLRHLNWLMEQAKTDHETAEKKRKPYDALIASHRITVLQQVIPFVATHQVVTIAQGTQVREFVMCIGECAYDYMRLRQTLELCNLVLQLRCTRCVA